MRNREEFISELTDLLNSAMDKYGVLVQTIDVIPTIVQWTIVSALEAGVSVEEFISSITDMPAAVEEIRNMVLLEIAEERPGSNPWDYMASIPVPLTLVGMFMFYTTACVKVAMASNATPWATDGNDSVHYMAHYLSEVSATGVPRIEQMEVLFGVGPRTVHDLIVPMPQPGMSHLRRFFDSCATRLETGIWMVPEDEGVTAEDLALSLRRQADMIGDLNKRFGESTGPRLGS
jgi:hypothetical protein